MLEIDKKYPWLVLVLWSLLVCVIPAQAIYQSSTFGNRSGIAGGCSDSGTTEWFCDGPSCADGYGFEAESGWTPTTDPGRWTAYYGAPESETITVAKGSVAMKIDAGLEYMRVDLGGATHSEIWIDFWVYPDTLNGSFKVFGEHTGTIKNYIIASSANGYQFYDGSSNYGSGVTCTVDTWQHLFVHIDVGAGDGSETVQLATNNQDTWDSWDYSATNLSLTDTEIDTTLDFGAQYNSNPDTLMLDGFRIFYGTDMPCEWQ